MLKWERKLVEIVDKQLPELVLILITFIAVYMRRAGIWDAAFDYQNNFYLEMPGYLHTPFYALFIKVLSFVPMTPIKTIKMIVSLFDFGVALAGIWLLRQKQNERNKVMLLACYALLLLSPLSIGNGMIWLHVDSICLTAMLCAWGLSKKEHCLWGGVLLGMAVSLQMQYMLALIGIMIYMRKERPGVFWQVGTGAAVICGLNLVAIPILGLEWQEGLIMLMKWLVVDPVSGSLFTDIWAWLSVMISHFGYAIGMMALLMAFLKPKFWKIAVSVHLIMILYVGAIPMQGHWWHG